jgi:hypothetical protein
MTFDGDNHIKNMGLLVEFFEFTPAILQRIGAFVIYWGIFEGNLELATWVLMGEKPEKGKRPITDCMQITQLIAQFRSASDGHIPEIIKAVRVISDTADDLLVFRNAIIHGRAIAPPAGGPKFINNAAWFDEKRKRSVTEAHISEHLLDTAIECITAIRNATFEVHWAGLQPKEEQISYVSHIVAVLRTARSQANKLGNFAALMTLEKP